MEVPEKLKEGEIGNLRSDEHLIPNTLRPQKLISRYYESQQQAKDSCLCNKILIVDDNEYNIYALETMLKMRGFMSDCTNNGKTAVKMIKDKWEVKKCNQKCPGY